MAGCSCGAQRLTKIPELPFFVLQMRQSQAVAVPGAAEPADPGYGYCEAGLWGLGMGGGTP